MLQAGRWLYCVVASHSQGPAADPAVLNPNTASSEASAGPAHHARRLLLQPPTRSAGTFHKRMYVFMYGPTRRHLILAAIAIAFATSPTPPSILTALHASPECTDAEHAKIPPVEDPPASPGSEAGWPLNQPLSFPPLIPSWSSVPISRW